MYKSNCQFNSRPVSTSIKYSKWKYHYSVCSVPSRVLEMAEYVVVYESEADIHGIETDLDEDNNLAIKTIRSQFGPFCNELYFFIMQTPEEREVKIDFESYALCPILSTLSILARLTYYGFQCCRINGSGK